MTTERDPSSAARASVPVAGTWLGAFGALPFLALGLALPFLEAEPRGIATLALVAYGAVILSFLGGIHWGLAIAGYGAASDHSASWRRLGISVVPSLVAWSALLLGGHEGLLLLAASFLLMLAVDLRATVRAEAPAWYPKLRWPLTTAVVASLGIGAFT